MLNEESCVEMASHADHNKALDKKEKDLQIHTRPNASSGFWLCTLLPLSYLISSYKYPKTLSIFEYKLTTVTAIGFNLQSICFFLYLNYKSNSLTNLIYTFLPSAITSFLIYYFVEGNSFFSIAFAFTTIFTYQYLHVKILRCLPKSFTLGEACIVLQGTLLFIINAILQIPKFVNKYPKTQLMEMQAIMMTALFALIILGLVLYIVKPLRKTLFFYPLMISYVLFVCLVPITRNYPIITLWNFITSDSYRILIITFYFGLVGLTTGAVIWRLNKSEKATTSIRKIFHIIVVLVFIPGMLYECTLLYIATGVALAFLIIFEILRVLKIPPFYESLQKMTELFIDEKDAGLIALTPIYLHIGCSLPLWINPSPCSIQKNLIPLLSGVISIGVGDTAASVIGSKFGEAKWPGTTKSIEGTLANVISQSVAIFSLFALGYVEITIFRLFIFPLTIVITSFIEAFTDQVDNLVLPLVFYIISSLG